MAARAWLAVLAVAAAASTACSAGATSVGTGTVSPTTALRSSLPTASPAHPVGPAPPAGGAISTTTIAAGTGSSGPAISSPGSSPIATPTPPISRAPVLGTIQLTAADDGGTFLVKVGQSVQLTLSTEGMQWSPVQEKPTGALWPEPVPAPPPHSQLVKWTARSRGAVNVTAVATAYCAAGTACPMFARLFQVTLEIS